MVDVHAPELLRDKAACVTSGSGTGLGRATALATETFVTKYPAALQEAARGGQPLPRFGHEKELAASVAYVATDAAEYVTGCVLRIDGGRDNDSSTFPPAGYVQGGQILAGKE